MNQKMMKNYFRWKRTTGWGIGFVKSDNRSSPADGKTTKENERKGKKMRIPVLSIKSDQSRESN